MNATIKPVVIVTGASGTIGSALCKVLQSNYTIVSMDRSGAKVADFSTTVDITKPQSISDALKAIEQRYGRRVAAVVHLAAYFDFTGEESPLYQSVNVEGTRNLLQALKSMEVERFIYASSMLVHKAQPPGNKVDENTALEPTWAYPKSKLAAEEVVRAEASMPFAILRLAGVYDDCTAVPTLSHQISRIFEQDFKSYLYAGDTDAGQALLHKQDMIDAFVLTVEQRQSLPPDAVMLIGEEQSASYEELQDRLGRLIHGDSKWQTIRMPKTIAKLGAWAQEKAEPLVPDSIDHGEKPFIRPFMIDLASDHYQLDCSRAKQWLGWQPKHNIFDGLADLVRCLKEDPIEWYSANRITPPDWMESAEERDRNPAKLQDEYERQYRAEHASFLWAPFSIAGLGAWLLASPITMGYAGTLTGWSEVICGVALMIFAVLALSWRAGWARLACGAIGLWLMLAPLIAWSGSAAAYLNSTLIGLLVTTFAVAARPAVGPTPVAVMTGPTVPPGWSYNPSSWFQRVPIIILALIGLLISRYMATYQLEQIDGVWDPFFSGKVDDPQNGTEEIITSSLSEAWPVPDAGLGALVYALEIIAGLMGSVRRWRTMPWLVVLFGFLIVPLGAVSITFIIIQPILLGTWCTLCLIAACAMLIQIPFSVDELVATSQFLWRRHKAGRPVLKIFFTGDTDDGPTRFEEDNFQQSAKAVLRECAGGGTRPAWGLWACVAIGIWLMLTRLTLGSETALANWEHFVGAMVITVAVTAVAEVARPVRLLIVPLAAILFFTPFVYDASLLATINSVLCGLALIGLSLPRGQISGRYGGLEKWLHKI